MVEQKCKNVRTCKQCSCYMFPSSGKILAKFYAICHKSELCRNFALFGGIFWHILELYVAFLGLLGLLRCFVANDICHNLCTFSGKIILAQTLLVSKSCIFASLKRQWMIS